MSVELRQPSQIEDCRHFFLVENGVIKVCKGNSGGENAILKRVYILPFIKSEEQKYCRCYFPFIRNFVFFSFEGGG